MMKLIVINMALTWSRRVFLHSTGAAKQCLQQAPAITSLNWLWRSLSLTTTSDSFMRNNKRKLVSNKDGEGQGMKFINVAALEQGCTQYYNNRNPRNLELLGVAEKPRGFIRKKRRVDFYHRLILKITNRYVSCYVEHNNGLRVLETSSKEFCVSKHLYKTSDIAAAYNVGRVMADRCKEMGLYRLMWEHKRARNSRKAHSVVNAILRGGIILNEPRPRKTLPEAGQLPP